MRLTQLEPRLVRYQTQNESERFAEGRQVPAEYSVQVSSLEQAQGLRFLCPVCFAKNGGAVGTHWCEVSFEGRGVKPQQGSHNKDGKPVRWKASGESLETLTLTPSIALEGGCAWHGFITAGEIR